MALSGMPGRHLTCRVQMPMAASWPPTSTSPCPAACSKSRLTMEAPVARQCTNRRGWAAAASKGGAPGTAAAAANSSLPAEGWLCRWQAAITSERSHSATWPELSPIHSWHPLPSVGSSSRKQVMQSWRRCVAVMLAKTRQGTAGGTPAAVPAGDGVLAGGGVEDRGTSARGTCQNCTLPLSPATSSSAEPLELDEPPALQRAGSQHSRRTALSNSAPPKLPPARQVPEGRCHTRTSPSKSPAEAREENVVGP